MRTVHWTVVVAIIAAALIGVVQATSISAIGSPASAAAPASLTALHMRMLHDARIIEVEHARWRGH